MLVCKIGKFNPRMSQIESGSRLAEFVLLKTGILLTYISLYEEVFFSHSTPENA